MLVLARNDGSAQKERLQPEYGRFKQPLTGAQNPTRVPDRHSFCSLLSQDHRPAVVAEPLARLPDRVVGRMRGAFSRRDLGMFEELANYLLEL